MNNFKCRVCSGTKFDQIIDLGLQPWGNDFIDISKNIDCQKYPLRLVFCKDCKTVQIDHTVKKEIMFGNHYYLSGTTNTLNNHFIEVNKKAISKFNLNKDKDKILDIGGNDGTYLEYFHKNNFFTLNVESSTIQSDICNKKKIKCVNKFFNYDLSKSIDSQYGKFQIIHGSGIFFHLEELKSVFDGIRYLLDPEKGVVVAEFIYLPDMIKNLAYDQIYHEHLLYYSLSSFQNLLDLFNLEIFDCYFNPIHGGSCVAYISHKDLFKKTNFYLNAINQELKEGFLSFDVYQKFSKSVNSLKNQTLELIDNLNRDNQKIYALGAPVKGSTMINYLQLNEKNIQCAVEINKYKVDTYIPGTKIPVKYQHNTEYPDYFFLLSWNFKKEILSKLGDFRDKGGKIIVPLPNLEII